MSTEDGWAPTAEVAKQVGIPMETQNDMHRLSIRLNRLYTLGILLRKPNPDHPGRWLWKPSPESQAILLGNQKVKLLSL